MHPDVTARHRAHGPAWRRPSRRTGVAALAAAATGLAVVTTGLAALTASAATVSYVGMSSLIPTSAVNGWGPYEKDMSNGEQAPLDGRTLTINGKTYGRGLGVHAPSALTYSLGKKYTSFQAEVGVDDEVGNGGSVTFEVWVDGTRKYASAKRTGVDAALAVKVDVTGRSTLKLVVTNGGDNSSNDHADWANSILVAAASTTSPTASPTVSPSPSATVSPSPNATVSPSPSSTVSPTTTAVSALTPATAVNGWGPMERNMSNGEQAAGDGTTLTIGGATYPSGLGVHAGSSLTYTTAGQYNSFKASIGVDDEVGSSGSLAFEVWADSTRKYVSPVRTGADAALPIAVDVSGAQTVKLVVTDGGDGADFDHADWAGATLSTATTTTTPSATASPSPTTSPSPSTVSPSPTSPSPSPSPTATSTSAPGAFPDASNTGPRAAGYTNLTLYTGPTTISTPGTVISGKEITQPITITADNVTLQGNNIHAATPAALIYVSGRNVKILDNEIHGNGNTTATSAGMAGLRLYGSYATMARNNVYNVNGHSVMLGETTDNLLEDNYFHDHVPYPTDSPHTNVLIVGERSGPARWTVRHNTMDMWVPGHMSNVINLAVGPGNSEGPMTFDNNLLAGGGFTIHAGGDTIQTGMVFIRNHFSTKYGPGCGAYAPVRLAPLWGQNGNKWGGAGYENVWHETGAVMPAP